MNILARAPHPGLGIVLALLTLAPVSLAQSPPKTGAPSVQGAFVIPGPQSGTVRVPAPLERTSGLAKLGLQPTQLQSGRAVTYSATNIEDRDGRLFASCVSISKSSGTWFLWGNGDRACLTVLSIRFRTERGKQYLVDFAFDPSTGSRQFTTYGATTGSTPQVVATVDGHYARVVTGTGSEAVVQLESVPGNDYALLYVKVTPLT
jgi:hypothetical protein